MNMCSWAIITMISGCVCALVQNIGRGSCLHCRVQTCSRCKCPRANFLDDGHQLIFLCLCLRHPCKRSPTIQDGETTESHPRTRGTSRQVVVVGPDSLYKQTMGCRPWTKRDDQESEAHTSDALLLGTPAATCCQCVTQTSPMATPVCWLLCMQ
jgi:hypothetical protein